MPLNVTIKDERDDKTVPPIDTSAFKVQQVFDYADIVVPEGENLDVEVVLRTGEESEAGRTPTSTSTPLTKKELYELELMDAKSGEEVKVWQEREVPDFDKWQIEIFLLPKEELTFGSFRAISRGISREVFTLSAFRSYGQMLPAIFATPKDFADEATKFADNAPWAVS